METEKEKMGNEEHMYWNIRRGNQYGSIAESHIYGLQAAKERLEKIQSWAKNRDWVLCLVSEHGDLSPCDFDNDEEVD